MNVERKQSVTYHLRYITSIYLHENKSCADLRPLETFGKL